MKTFNQLLAAFKTEDDCKRYLQQRRWPDGVRCPRCGNQKVFHVTHRPFHWVCKTKDCGGRNGYRFSVITKTVFENTKYPLRTWFQVMFIMGHAKKGISAHQIHRMMGTGSYETAWYMCTRIRAAMKDNSVPKLLGDVKADETFIGGNAQNMHKSKRNALDLTGTKGKIPVIGAISRKVHHARGEYVVGTTHTNSIESFWSLIKRGVMGSCYKISKEYLPLYLNELQFRFNNRKNPDIFDLILAGC